LAHRLYLCLDEFILASIDKVGELVQQICALGSRRGSPWLEGCAGSSDGGVNFSFAGAVDLTDRFIGGGIEDLVGNGGRAFDKLVVYLSNV
jgi:hypothetical protein